MKKADDCDGRCCADRRSGSGPDPQGQTHASHDYRKFTASSEKPDCKATAKKMGLGQQHSHAEQKGVVAKSAMNKEHDRCRAEAKKTPDKAK